MYLTYLCLGKGLLWVEGAILLCLKTINYRSDQADEAKPCENLHILRVSVSMYTTESFCSLSQLL